MLDDEPRATVNFIESQNLNSVDRLPKSLECLALAPRFAEVT
jgi:hypothetical protein